MPIYEYDPSGLIELQSERNTTGFEYEDAGVGVTYGVFSVLAKPVEQ